MIINEKYLQDIDDEDEDVAVSDEIANNRYDFEVTIEYRKEVPLWGGYMPGGGEGIGLTGIKLVIGIIGNAVLGALMTAGVGLFAPCMALCYFLGLSSQVVFPIMMGSCAMLQPVSSVKFIKEGAYPRKASLVLSLCGAVGVFVAAFIVKSLPIETLKWLVMAVLVYTGASMIAGAKKNLENEADVVVE